jgi:Xaa-Pro aminopeptidase
MEAIKNNLTQRKRIYQCGQPMPTTHPHLLKHGEVLPGISLQELKRRRSKLIKNIMLEMQDKRQQIVIIPAASIVYMSDKIPYIFRQNTDFLYFSGYREPDSILVLVCKENQSSFTLFIRPRDEHSELWDGPRTNIETAIEIFGMDHALPVTKFEQFLTSLIQKDKKSTVWYDHVDVVQPILHKKLCQLIKLTDNQMFVSPKVLFHQIRLIKNASEIDLMRQSCQIASHAIIKTIQYSRPGINEHQLFATIDYECRIHGADHLAYPPVVASGENTNVIHYINNNQIIQNGNLVLMDAGS